MTLAANILDFAEITGGTGTEAVERLNSLVKTGVIAEADMGVTMDKLTIAHQRWGGSINEVMDALTKFAPAMNALGMSTDEAISWMTIFNKAGVDSQRVVMGFTRRWPRSSRPRIQTARGADRATPDDFKRSELAVDLFGSGPGPRSPTAATRHREHRGLTRSSGRTTRARSRRRRGQRQHVRRPGAADAPQLSGHARGARGELGTSSDAI